jgi:hypothetical protein
MKSFIATYRWDGRCNAFERRARVVVAENEDDALSFLTKTDPDIKNDNWNIEEIDMQYCHVEKVTDIDWN